MYVITQHFFVGQRIQYTSGKTFLLNKMGVHETSQTYMPFLSCQPPAKAAFSLKHVHAYCFGQSVRRKVHFPPKSLRWFYRPTL